ncbi:MAG: crossover junction endodeoxyribonuclease RuvC [Deltaproteobacteria bacterium]|nr:crossover junction endodeoxyribonuclease RuvC [Deltaproteobacteria bacterium]
MRVLGIDPGSTCTGYGVLEEVDAALRLVASGVIRPGRGKLARRLGIILQQVDALIASFHPDAVAVEAAFHGHNAKSTLVLGQARGAALAAAGRAGVEVLEYPTRQVKQTVTGHGAADKRQVRRVLQLLLGELPEQLDATDAIAVALCHLRWQAAPGSRAAGGSKR